MKYLKLGIGLFFFGVISFLYQLIALQGVVYTTGTAQLTHQYVYGSRGYVSSAFGNAIDFKDKNGRLYQYQTLKSEDLDVYRSGDVVPVFYDPNSPYRCGTATFGAHFGFPWFLICVGLAFVVTPIGNYYLSRYINRIYLNQKESSSVQNL
jgi:hypothetical protein